MIAIEMSDTDITLRVLGSHKIWALKSAVRFRKDQVVSVAEADLALRPPWLRCPGTAIPWLICAGTYYGGGRKEFWDRTFRGKGIRIDLRHGPYSRIVVDVADPAAAIKTLTSISGSGRPTGGGEET